MMEALAQKEPTIMQHLNNYLEAYIAVVQTGLDFITLLFKASFTLESASINPHLMFSLYRKFEVLKKFAMNLVAGWQSYHQMIFRACYSAPGLMNPTSYSQNLNLYIFPKLTGYYMT